MFSFVWLIWNWQPQECCLHILKFFYLSTVSRITLSLLVNFQTDALCNFLPFVKYKKQKTRKTP